MASPVSYTGTGTIWEADREPTNTEAGVDLYNFWVNTTTYSMSICIDATPGSLQWMYIH